MNAFFSGFILWFTRNKLSPCSPRAVVSQLNHKPNPKQDMQIISVYNSPAMILFSQHYTEIVIKLLSFAFQIEKKCEQKKSYGRWDTQPIFLSNFIGYVIFVVVWNVNWLSINSTLSITNYLSNKLTPEAAEIVSNLIAIVCIFVLQIEHNQFTYSLSV